MNTSLKNLTFGEIFRFWSPLAGTWVMMSLEGPFIAAIIARLADAKFNLAAYGVAFSFALMVEAPIIMMLSASVALVRDRQSFLKLKHFTYWLNGMITVVMLIILYPPIFNFIASDLIDLPDNVAHLTHISLAILLPWPAAIGYRRFYQGVLIRHNLTRRVAYGTVVRLSTMGLTALMMYFFFAEVPGAYVGAMALSVGVTLEATATRLMAWHCVKSIMEKGDSTREDLTYWSIVEFYYPLALSSMLSMGSRPLVAFFLGQSRAAIESLAVLPVVHSTMFIFMSTGLAFQEVALTLLGDRYEGLKPIRGFAIRLGIILVTGLSLIAFTPLSEIWFRQISGLSVELTQFAIPALQIVVLMPALAVLIAFQRAALVNAKKTTPITIATAIEVFGMLGILFMCIHGFNLVGIFGAMIAALLGRSLSNGYLFPHTIKTLNS